MTLGSSIEIWYNFLGSSTLVILLNCFRKSWCIHAWKTRSQYLTSPFSASLFQHLIIKSILHVCVISFRLLSKEYTKTSDLFRLSFNICLKRGAMRYHYQEIILQICQTIHHKIVYRNYRILTSIPILFQLWLSLYSQQIAALLTDY